MTKKAKTIVKDTAVFNLLTRGWVREGRELDDKQAYNRLAYRKRTSPDAEFKIVSVQV